MEVTAKSMRNAGALRQLCLFHAFQGSKDHDWQITIDHAKREFRDVPDAILDELILMCMDAALVAQRTMSRSSAHPDFIPD